MNKNYLHMEITNHEQKDVLMGVKIIVPGLLGKYMKKRKNGKTRVNIHSKSKFTTNSSFPTHWYILHAVHFLHIWYMLMTYFMREKKDTSKNSKP